MKNVKETIAKNLVELRKANKMTQGALAEKLNYSDKAISRWEHAETLPDIETLCTICDIYGVTFEYLLQEEQPEKNPYVKRSHDHTDLISCLISIFTVWLCATVAFTSISALWDTYMWQMFIWAIPVSGFIAARYNRLYWHNKLWSILLNSFNTWTTIAALYLQLVDYNLWMLFLIGIPLQALIILTKTKKKAK